MHQFIDDALLRFDAIPTNILLPHKKVTIPIAKRYLMVWNMFNCNQNIPNNANMPGKK